MNSALHKKLRIKAGLKIGMINKPKDVEHAILPLPESCYMTRTATQQNDILFWFVKNKAEFETGLDKAIALLTDHNIIWIGYPKGSSGLQTDLNRDHGWENLRSRDDIAFVGFISYDKIWSTFCIRKKTAADKKREVKPQVREILKYADSKTKTILLPEDLASALSKNKAAKSKFESLAFSHKREYVDWIVSAKKEETRTNRIEGTIQKLNAGLKNPSGRP